MRRYRGKRVDTGQWVYGYLIGNDVIVGEVVELNEDYFNTEWWCRVDPVTVGQCTGLKDRNGVEMYEGDIVLMPHYQDRRERIPGVVKFVDAKFIVDVVDVEYDGNLFGRRKIISNIHDRPDLVRAQ